MDTLLFSILIGVAIGIVDIIPMFIQKLPKHSIVSAFCFYFFASIIIFHSHIPVIPWWLEGGLIAFCLMIPIMVHVGANDKKPLPIIAINAIVLGSLIGVIKHFF